MGDMSFYFGWAYNTPQLSKSEIGQREAAARRARRRMSKEKKRQRRKCTTQPANGSKQRNRAR